MRCTYALAVFLMMGGFSMGCHEEPNLPAPQPAAKARVTKAPVHADAAGTDDRNTREAVAVIHGAGAAHDKVHGVARFTQLPGGVKIVVDVDGLTPGEHGIHIHEKPDLSDAKLLSAGGHYNPNDAAHRHAGPEDPLRHAGDLGNIEVNRTGHGHLELVDSDLSINGKNAVVGHSLIIHEKQDDLKSQPAGNAGARVAGGVIVLAVGEEKTSH